MPVPPFPIRTPCRVAAALVSMAATFAFPGMARAEGDAPPPASPAADRAEPADGPRPVPTRLEIGPDVGWAHRPARDDGRGVEYRGAPAWGVHAQAHLTGWLRLSPYVLTALHEARVPPGALGEGGARADVGGSVLFRSYVLGARLQPTWSPLSRAHLWASAGLGWGKILAPSMRVAADAPYDLGARDGVFVETPFGAGGSFEVLPALLGVGFDVAWGPVYSQDGDLYQTVQAVDASGRIVHARGLPKTASSFAAVAGVTLHL